MSEWWEQEDQDTQWQKAQEEEAQRLDPEWAANEFEKALREAALNRVEEERCLILQKHS